MQAGILVSKRIRCSTLLVAGSVFDDVPAVDAQRLVGALGPLDAYTDSQWLEFELQPAVAAGQLR